MVKEQSVTLYLLDVMSSGTVKEQKTKAQKRTFTHVNYVQTIQCTIRQHITDLLMHQHKDKDD